MEKKRESVAEVGIDPTTTFSRVQNRRARERLITKNNKGIDVIFVADQRNRKGTHTYVGVKHTYVGVKQRA
jgi:hypothetical protein